MNKTYQYKLSLHNTKQFFEQSVLYIPANIYLLKFNCRITRKKCKICSKLTIKTPKEHSLRPSSVFLLFKFNVPLEYLMLTLHIFHTFLKCFY